MAVTPLSGQTICSTFNQLALTDGTNVYDASGNLINIISQTAVSSSYAITASHAMIATTASYIDVTGSGVLINWNGSQLQLTASAAPIETGSIITTGSIGLVQAVTGTLNIQTSSILSLVATGSLLGTASAALFASQSISSSYAVSTSLAISSSYAVSTSLAISSSYALSASYAVSTSVAISSSYALSASYAEYASQSISASYAVSTSVAISSSYALSASHAQFASQSISSSYAISSSIAQTSSYIRVVNGPGIEPIQYLGDGFAITASLRSVNGIFPINGNVNTALTSVITGLSSSLIASSSGGNTGSITEGTVWVVSGETGSASGSNGLSYIFDSASADNGYSGSWIELSSFNYAIADARYVMLNGANTPMLGQLNMGGYNITNLATASNPGDAVPLGQLTQSLSGYLLTASFNTWTGSNTSSIAGTASYALSASLTVTSSYAISSSYALSASHAITASYVNITGSGITVNYNGSQIQLTGSDAVGFVYTSSAVAQVLSSSISQSGDLRIDNGLLILSQVSMSLNFVNDAAAAAGGVPLGGLYRTGNMIVIRLV